MHVSSRIAGGLTLLLAAACAGPAVSDTGRGGGVAHPLADPAWVIVLDHHQRQYPDQVAYVFSAADLETCREQDSYAESDLNWAPKEQYEVTEVEAKSLTNARRGGARPGHILKLERRR